MYQVTLSLADLRDLAAAKIGGAENLGYRIVRYRIVPRPALTGKLRNPPETADAVVVTFGTNEELRKAP